MISHGMARKEPRMGTEGHGMVWTRWTLWTLWTGLGADGHGMTRRGTANGARFFVPGRASGTQNDSDGCG